MKFYLFLFTMKLGSKILNKEINVTKEPIPFQKTDLDCKSGFDMRFQNNTTPNPEEIFRLKKNLEIKNLLKSLEYYKDNDLKRMDLLNQNSFLFNDTITPNLLSGGLLDDFNYEIF